MGPDRHVVALRGVAQDDVDRPWTREPLKVGERRTTVTVDIEPDLPNDGRQE
jgi:hypothetical protein